MFTINKYNNKTSNSVVGSVVKTARCCTQPAIIVNINFTCNRVNLSTLIIIIGGSERESRGALPSLTLFLPTLDTENSAQAKIRLVILH